MWWFWWHPLATLNAFEENFERFSAMFTKSHLHRLHRLLRLDVCPHNLAVPRTTNDHSLLCFACAKLHRWEDADPLPLASCSSFSVVNTSQSNIWLHYRERWLHSGTPSYTMPSGNNEVKAHVAIIMTLRGNFWRGMCYWWGTSNLITMA